jgi:hypothetical protein
MEICSYHGNTKTEMAFSVEINLITERVKHCARRTYKVMEVKLHKFWSFVKDGKVARLRLRPFLSRHCIRDWVHLKIIKELVMRIEMSSLRGIELRASSL